MFYAVSMRRINVVRALDDCGCRIDSTCDDFKQMPIVHAERLDDTEMIELINSYAGREERAWALLMRNYASFICVKRYNKMREAIPLLQRVYRGHLGRRKVNVMQGLEEPSQFLTNYTTTTTKSSIDLDNEEYDTKSIATADTSDST